MTGSSNHIVAKPKVRKVLIKYVTCHTDAVRRLLVAVKTEESGLTTSFIRKLRARIEAKVPDKPHLIPKTNKNIGFPKSRIIKHIGKPNTNKDQVDFLKNDLASPNRRWLISDAIF